MARLRFTNRVRVCCNVVLPVEYFSSNGQLCLNCLCQPRGQAHSLTSQLSIEASVRLLELRQDSGEEQTHRCRRRSPSPRPKRSKVVTRVSHPLKPNRNAKLRHFQSRQGLKIPKQWRGEVEPGSRATANFQPAACPQFW